MSVWGRRWLIALVLVTGANLAASAQSINVQSLDWPSTKELAASRVHWDDARTFYCGCALQFNDQAANGSGAVEMDDCISESGEVGAVPPGSMARSVHWEHVVPVSLTPARQLDCWTREDGSRQVCERESAEAREIFNDLHNIVPITATLNIARRAQIFGDVQESSRDFGVCSAALDQDQFEPPSCKRGDVARIWLYMIANHGVSVDASFAEMLHEWSVADPVSPWESRREQRIYDATGRANPLIRGITADISGACPWEFVGNANSAETVEFPPGETPGERTNGEGESYDADEPDPVRTIQIPIMLAGGVAIVLLVLGLGLFLLSNSLLRVR